MKNLILVVLACTHWTFALAQGNAAGAPAQSQPPLNTIASLDVPRYMGTWYEIAKYPNWFQKKCVADTRADYQLQANGRVQVTNQCRQVTGEMDVAIGEARQIGPSTSPKLQVRFAPSWLSMLPFVWGDYWVVDLDEGYQLVAVSEPKREYLWVLSRTPKVAPGAFDALMGKVLQELKMHMEPPTIQDSDSPVRQCHRYLSNRTGQLDYQGAIKRGLPIGSGEIESAHRYIVQQRLKRPGAWWCPDNAEHMLALQLNRANRQWATYWQRISGKQPSQVATSL